MAYESLKASTDAKVYPNNNKEIEAAPVNILLHDYISQLGNFECGGEITPTTLFDFNIELKWWFIAVESGTYTNFDGIELDGETAVILYEDGVFTAIRIPNLTSEQVDLVNNSVQGAASSTVNEVSIYSATDGKAVKTSGKIIVSNQTDLKTALALTTAYKIEVTKDLTVSGTVTLGAAHVIKGTILTFADGIIFSSTSATGCVLDANCNFLGDSVYTSDYNSSLRIRQLTGTPTFTKTTANTLNLFINSVSSTSSVESTAGTITLNDEEYWSLGGGGGHEIYSQESETALEQREALRFKGFLKATDNATSDETEVDINQTVALCEDDFMESLGFTCLKLAENKMYIGDSDSKTTQEYFYTILASYISSRFDVNATQLRLLCTENKLLGGNASGVAEEKSTVELFNIIEATATANGELSFDDIDENTFTISDHLIDYIMVDTDANVTISLGTTSSGTDIVNAEALTGKTDITPLVRYLTGGIYISSADWNSATVSIQIQIRKAWL